MNFVLIHGGGGVAAVWDLVASELSQRGHDVIAMDLPNHDSSAGWTEYTDTVVDTVGDRSDLVAVAHSVGGFVAPLVCERLSVRLMILVTGMIPAPGETFEEWWSNTHHDEVGVDFSNETAFYQDLYHDVPADLAKFDWELHESHPYIPSEPWPLAEWPDVPTRYLLCRGDRTFPPDFVRRVVRERLDIEPDEMDGGHMVMLSRPKELAAKLIELSG